MNLVCFSNFSKFIFDFELFGNFRNFNLCFRNSKFLKKNPRNVCFCYFWEFSKIIFWFRNLFFFVFLFETPIFEFENLNFWSQFWKKWCLWWKIRFSKNLFENSFLFEIHIFHQRHHFFRNCYKKFKFSNSKIRNFENFRKSPKIKFGIEKFSRIIEKK